MTSTVENYLKALVSIDLQNALEPSAGCSVNVLSDYLQVAPATVNSMVKKLKQQSLVDFEPYGKIFLTEKGRLLGIDLLRKHRIWKAFLGNVLHFSWQEINEIADQLEHVKSHKLIARIEELSGFPRVDPHGDAIPDQAGNIPQPLRKALSEVSIGKEGYISAVKDHSFDFLSFADKMDMKIGKAVKLLSKNNFEGLITVQTENGTHTLTSRSASNFLMVCPICVKGKSCGKSTCVFSE